MLLDSIFNSRKKAQMDPATIRQRLSQEGTRRTALEADRQRLALPEAEGDLEVAARRVLLDAEIATVDRQIAILEDARPAAFAREQEAQRQERGRLIDILIKARAEQEKARDHLLAALKGKPDPEIEEMKTLWMLGRECSDLGYAVAAATGERFEPFDALDALRFVKHQQHTEFIRRLDRVRPPGVSRPDLSGRPWQATVARLRELRELEPAT